MARVFMSFLGTNNYVPCNYFIEQPEKKEVKNVRFVQEAITSLYCRKWTKSDRIMIFTTKASYEQNWLNDGHVDREKNIIPSEGLEERLLKLELGVPIKTLRIKEGLTEQDIWDVFNTVYANINEGDEVIFDITHAFRSIPMLAIVILNYAKVLKNIRIIGLHYGPFEKLGRVEDVKNMDLNERNVPILDLSAFDSLLDWSFGVERFVTSGDASKLSVLMHDDVNPIIKETKGGNLDAKNLFRLGKGLNDFSKIIATNRAPKVSEQAQFCIKCISEYHESDLLPAFKPLMDKIKQRFDPFNGDTVIDGISASRWCLNHSDIQQGITILRETMITHLVLNNGGDIMSTKDRDIAAHIATGIERDGAYDVTSDSKLEPFKEYSSRLYDYLKERTELTNSIVKLGPIRNDINHAGYNKSARSPDDFSHELEKYIEQFETFLLSQQGVHSTKPE